MRSHWFTPTLAAYQRRGRCGADRTAELDVREVRSPAGPSGCPRDPGIRDASVRLDARLGQELDACGRESRVDRVEVIDAKEQANAAGELRSGDRDLLPIGARQQHAGLRTTRTDHHPAFRPSVIRGRRDVLDELEPEHLDEELNRRVVLPNDERHEVKVRHRSQRILRCLGGSLIFAIREARGTRLSVVLTSWVDWRIRARKRDGRWRFRLKPEATRAVVQCNRARKVRRPGTRRPSPV